MLSMLLFAAVSADAAFKAQLQGKSRGSATWIAGNLQDWRDLDEIPCRVYLTGGPSNGKVIKVEFDRLQGRNPGIQDIYGFVPSANVAITSQPVLSAPANSPRWTYTFTIKLLDAKPGFVKFTAKLAAGAHLNGGSSVGMRGSPALGNLQIHKISPAAAIVDLTLSKTGPSEAAPGQTITYTLQYSNKASATAKAIGVQISDTLPAQVTVIPASLGTGRVVSNTVVWTLNSLSPGASGSLSYSVQVKADTAYGVMFTNMAVITSCNSTQSNCKSVTIHKSKDSHEKVCPSEADPNDNRASIVTRVVFNRAPAANPDSYQGTQDQPLIIPSPGVLTNDTDLDNDPLTAILASGPAHGTVVLNADGSFIYTPVANYNGEDSFTYKANDGMADSSAVSVHILLLPKPSQNHAPVAVNDQYQVLQDAVLTVPAPGVLANDTDADNNPLRAILVSPPAHGTIILNTNGSFVYTPTSNYHGEDTFTYKANDGFADSAVASVIIRVLPKPSKNRPPVAVNDQYQVLQDTVLNVSAPGVLANDTDADNNPLSTIMVTTAAHGTVVLTANGSFVYTPTTDYHGEDSFTYKANDGLADSAFALVLIQVLPKPSQNNPPVAANDQYDVLQDSTLNVSAPGVLANDTDADNNPLRAILVAAPTHGTVVLNANGSFAYVPTANYQGQDTFTYKANDGMADSALASVFIRVMPKPAQNNPPLAADDEYTATTNSPLNVPAPGVLANDTDADGDEMTAILVTQPTHGTLIFNANGSFQYTPAPGFTGIDIYTYRTSDGLTSSLPATVTILVQGRGGTNDPRSNLGPIVNLTSPTNGAIYIEGMDIPLVADASDPDGTVTNVSFMSDVTFLGSDDEAEYSLLLNNVLAGEYVFRATATDNEGATGISSPVSVTVLRNPPFASGSFRLNRQTGLFEQTVTITNPTPVDFPGIRLWIMNVRLAAAIWNATGYSGGVPYIDVPGIPAGGSGEIIVEYYTPDLRAAPDPNFLPEVR